MKKLYFLITLFAALLSFSCGNPNTEPPAQQEEEMTPGWYLYTTDANSNYPQETFFYINTSGKIERAGSISNEYSGTQLELLQGQISYSICKKNADGITITFEKTDAPIWAIENNNTDNIEAICPYAEGEYLDVAKNSIFPWPANKNLQLWSAKEFKYTCSCAESFGYINAENIFVVGKSLSANNFVTITMEDTLGNIFNCDILFTEAISSGSDTPDNNTTIEQWGIGYEWWVFEKALVGSLDCFVLYDGNGKAVRAGSIQKEEQNSFYLVVSKTQAINNFIGTCHKVTDLTQLPSWCFSNKD